MKIISTPPKLNDYLNLNISRTQFTLCIYIFYHTHLIKNYTEKNRCEFIFNQDKKLFSQQRKKNYYKKKTIERKIGGQ